MEYDLTFIEEECSRKIEVEENGEFFIDEKWECPMCGELYNFPKEALDCCKTWAERDPEGYKEYMFEDIE